MIKNKNIDKGTPARSEFVRDSRIIRLLPTLAAGFCSSQNLVTGTPLTLALDGLYVANKQTVDSAGTPTVSTTSGTLLEPSDLWFTTGAATAVLTGVVDGIDHLGNPVYLEFTKATGQTVFTLGQTGQVNITKNGDPNRGIPARASFTATGNTGVYVCFSAINAITLTLSSANTTVTVGPINNATQANRMPRLPLPVPIDNGSDLCDRLLLVSTGGATVTTPAAVPGKVAYATTSYGGGDGGTDTIIISNAGFVETVAGTAPYEFRIGYRGGRTAAQ